MARIRKQLHEQQKRSFGKRNENYGGNARKAGSSFSVAVEAVGETLPRRRSHMQGTPTLSPAKALLNTTKSLKTALPSEPVKAFTSLMGSNDKSSAMQILAIPVSKISEPIALGSQSQAETGTTPRSCTSSSFAAKASAKAALDVHVGALVQADLVTCEASPLASILSTNSIHFKPSCSGHL